MAWKIALDLDHYPVMSTEYRWNEMRKAKHILSMKIAATAKEEEVRAAEAFDDAAAIMRAIKGVGDDRVWAIGLRVTMANRIWPQSGKCASE